MTCPHSSDQADNTKNCFLLLLVIIVMGMDLIFDSAIGKRLFNDFVRIRGVLFFLFF